MPSMFGKDSKKKELIKNLDSLYAQVHFVARSAYFQKLITIKFVFLLLYDSFTLPYQIIQLQREHQISPGDFPDIKRMKEQLMHQDFTKFRQLDMKLLQKVYDFFVFPNTVHRISVNIIGNTLTITLLVTSFQIGRQNASRRYIETHAYDSSRGIDCKKRRNRQN